MDPFQAFGIDPAETSILRGAGQGISARKAPPPPTLQQRMAGAALMAIPPLSRAWATLKMLDAGPVAPATLDEARRQGLY